LRVVRYSLGCRLAYDIGSDATFIFNVEVARTARTKIVKESLVLTPPLAQRVYVDATTHNRYLGVNVSPGALALEYNVEVEHAPHYADPASIGETAVGQLPLEILPYLLPSRYVPSDRLAAFAHAEFDALPAGHGRVSAIRSWIYERLEYQRGSSTEETTADETLLKRAGICRDFAHLGMAFCRSLDIPARFVSCYAYGLVPPDFHAVFEAYLDQRWWLFDATRQAHLDGLVRIGIGRDAADVAFSTPFGDFEPTAMHVRISRPDGDADQQPRTAQAISNDDAATSGSA
jgi:transglutaminase-like putative cysteine protease